MLSGIRQKPMPSSTMTTRGLFIMKLKRSMYVTGASLAILFYAGLASADTLQAEADIQNGNDRTFTFPDYTGGVSSTYTPGGANYWGSPFEYVNNVNLSNPFDTAANLQALGFDVSSFTYHYNSTTQTTTYSFIRADMTGGYTTVDGNIQNIYQYDFAENEYQFYDAGFGEAANFSTSALLSTLKSTQPVLGYGVFDFQNSFVTYDGTSDPVSLAQIIVDDSLVEYSFADGQNISINWLSERPIASLALTYYDMSPVPEPESWAMLLVGLGVMGMVAHRRVR